MIELQNICIRAVTPLRSIPLTALRFFDMGSYAFRPSGVAQVFFPSFRAMVIESEPNRYTPPLAFFLPTILPAR